MNISSIVVMPRPGAAGTVEAQLREIPGVEVHAAAPDGRMIVTIEADDDGATTRTYEFISQMADVLSASMVYHQKESDPETEITVEA